MAQTKALNNGIDCVIGTPGRIMDFFERGNLNLSEMESIILDEGDRMLDMGFQETVTKLLQGCTKLKQVLLFSATLPPWIKNLVKQYMPQPVLVDLLGDDRINNDIQHYFHIYKGDVLSFLYYIG